MASTTVAIPVVRATGSIAVSLRVDRRRARKRIPAETARRRRHLLVPLAPPKRRHRKLASSGPFEDVAALVDHAVDVAGLARDADLALDDVVVRLELIETEGPVFDGR